MKIDTDKSIFTAFMLAFIAVLTISYNIKSIGRYLNYRQKYFECREMLNRYRGIYVYRPKQDLGDIKEIYIDGDIIQFIADKDGKCANMYDYMSKVRSYSYLEGTPPDIPDPRRHMLD
jgi:hypothetical protein